VFKKAVTPHTTDDGQPEGPSRGAALSQSRIMVYDVAAAPRRPKERPGLSEQDEAERALMLSGKIAARQLQRGAAIGDFRDVEFSVFSQGGEDGIIEWLVAHLTLPNTRFVEFGVETFREANCRFLLENRNWRGLVMDGGAANMDNLRSRELYWKFDVTALAAMVTAENINPLITEAGFAGPLGILSIDIDGNDFWVWRAIDCVAPAIVICEFNAVLGDRRPVVVPYDPAFTRFKYHYSGLYLGCSILALQRLADQKGYAFVGTSSNGVNAFFVRKDLAGPLMPLIGAPRAFPSRFRDGRDQHGRLAYAGGLDRFALLRGMPLIDIDTGETVAIDKVEDFYSEDWITEVTG